MKTLRLLLFGILTLAATFAQAQTADEIINKTIEAMGGMEAWNKVTSLRQEGELTVQGGIKVDFVTTVLHNKGMRLDLAAMGLKGYQIMTPTGGWNYMPFQGQTKAEPVTDEQRKESADAYDVQGSFFDYKKKGNTITLLGTEDIEGVDAYKIQVVQKNGKTESLFIDPKSYFIIRSVSKVKANGQEMDQTTTLSNYKKLPEGIFVPMNITLPDGELVVKKVTVNAPIDEAIFKPSN
ncbi:MAG: outer rane lipoproteinsorting protein [Flaviaesturariibacter sp.]|nr:outer rane lipoproteinsorting protein [Flaviaesturariibacter sp.]